MLRSYQIPACDKAEGILRKLRIVYLAAEMRTGKTTIALTLAHRLGCKNVLYVTKKKVVDDKVVENDYTREGFTFHLDVTNYEQLSKYKPIYDMVIADEAHSFGAYPKPSGRQKELKRITGRAYLVLSSGTPNPESYSQLYHQFDLSDYTPFEETNFYRWAKAGFVNIKEKVFNGVKHNDYDSANKEVVLMRCSEYFVTLTQADAGFVHSDVEEVIIKVSMAENLNWLIDYLRKKFVYTFKDGQSVVCDTAVKLQSKIHQLNSGTVKTEDGDAKILDRTKAEYIRDNYQGRRIAVYYQFIAEGFMLKQTLSNWTDSPAEFRKSKDKIFICQIQSGSMGIDLSDAELLIFLNINFSAVQYWQARARLSSLTRTSRPLVHWIFAEGGIEEKIYKCVQNKKDYTNYYFKKDYGIENSRENFRVA